MGVTRREFTFEERQKIEELIKAHPDLSLTKIASMLDRSKNGVLEEIRKNGGRENYSAHQAQERRNKLREVKYQYQKNLPPEEYPMARMKSTIETLQMQIEILYGQIKQLKGES